MPKSEREDRAFLTLLLVVGCLLLLTRLGDQALWQDEAETALLGRSILEYGLPTAYDGRNLISQESQAEFSADDYRWFWTPWLQHYLTAASFSLLGTSTFAARLPFALLGVGCLLLTYRLTFRLTRDRRAARMAALILLFSVPFLLHMRQARYYAGASFFTLLLLQQYLGVLAGRPWAHWGLVLAGVGLFHSHFVICAAVLLATVIHYCAAAHAKDRLPKLLLAWGAIVGLCAPWAWFFAQQSSGSALPGLGRGLYSLGMALDHLNRYAFPLVLLLTIPTFWAPDSLRRLENRTREIWLIPITGLVCTLTLCFVMPYFFFRYYAVLIPLGAVLQGVLLGRVWHWQRSAALLLLTLILATDLLPRAFPYRRALPRNDIRYLKTGDEEPGQVVGTWARFSPFAAFLYELAHEYDGPLEAIAAYLNEHGSPEDTVVATYGDLPLQFYTPMRVVGGLSGLDPTPYLDAEWILIRAHPHRRADAELGRKLMREVDWSRYEAIVLEVLDTPFENRPAPSYHKFRTVDTGPPPVRIFRRRPTSAE